MLPQLAALIAVYCVLRLAEMTVAHLERAKAGQVSKLWQGFWIFYVLGGIVIVLLTMSIYNHAGKASAAVERFSR